MDWTANFKTAAWNWHFLRWNGNFGYVPHPAVSIYRTKSSICRYHDRLRYLSKKGETISNLRRACLILSCPKTLSNFWIGFVQLRAIEFLAQGHSPFLLLLNSHGVTWLILLRTLVLLIRIDYPWLCHVKGWFVVRRQDSIFKVGKRHTFKYQSLKFAGLFTHLQDCKDQGTLKHLAKDGSLHCVFVCCDCPYQYLDDYFEKLGEEHFHSIINKVRRKNDR